ncbi:hypothetical protein, partial [Microcoleus anatoxicus]
CGWGLRAATGVARGVVVSAHGCCFANCATGISKGVAAVMRVGENDENARRFSSNTIIAPLSKTCRARKANSLNGMIL